MKRTEAVALLATAFFFAGCGSDAPGDASRADASRADAGADAEEDVPADADADAILDAPAHEPHGDGLRWRLLSETDLYADFTSRTLGPGTRPFEPTFVLWSDGAEKHRFIRLPVGGQVDTSDPDRWRFPVGTRVWKEFRRDGRPIETRMIERVGDTGDEEADWFMAAFAWREDQSDADVAPDGVENALGTTHDIPAMKRCWACHQGEPGHLLGFSALQLAKAPGATTLRALADEGLLTVAPDAAVWAGAPGTDLEAAAIGTLHANCGHCHNPRGISWPDASMNLRLDAGTATVQASNVWKTAVGVALSRWKKDGYMLRIAPGRPDESGMVHRMSVRGGLDQMPPLATEVPDDKGIAAVRAWIESL